MTGEIQDRLVALEERAEAHKIALTDINRRLDALESLTNRFRPLGPRPEDPIAKMRQVDKAVADLREKLREQGIQSVGTIEVKVDAPPVDRSARVLVGGAPVTDDHLKINPETGMQKDYVVLTVEERSKGFVRPVRMAYIHVGKPPLIDDNSAMDSRYKYNYDRFKYPIRGDVRPFPGGCLTRTEMHRDIAETYARDNTFYSGTYCASCRAHFPLEQFIWEGTTERVGS